MTEEERRDRGILTPVDREYLLGNRDYNNKQQEINRRSNIRNRIRNSIIDFNILFERLSERDRKQIFDDVDAKNMQITGQTKVGKNHKWRVGEPSIEKGLIDGIAFFYQACGDSGIPFDEILEESLKRAEDDMIISISVQKPDDLVDNAASKLLNDEPLSREESQALAQRIDEKTPDAGPAVSLDHPENDQDEEENSESDS